MSLYRNILSNAGATAVGSGIQLFLLLALVRWLSLEQFAVFITVTAIVGFGEMASDFGVRIWGTRQFAIKANAEGILGPALSAKIIFSVLLTLIVLLLPFRLLTIQQALLAALVACTQPSTDPFLWYLRGKERLDVEAILTLVWRAINALLLGLMAWGGHDIDQLLAFWGLTNVCRMIVEWHIPQMADLKKARWFDAPKRRTQIVAVLHDSLPVGAAFLLMAVYQRLGVLMLGMMATHDAVSYFGAAFTLVSSAVFVATSITVSSFPGLVRAVEGNDWIKAAEICERKLQLIMWVFLPACFIGIWISPAVIHWLYSTEFLPSAAVMVALMPGLYISSVNFSLKYCMNACHQNLTDIVAVVVGTIVFAGIMLLAEGNKLLEAASLAWGVGELAIFIFRGSVLTNKYKLTSLPIYRHVGFYAVLLMTVYLI